MSNLAFFSSFIIIIITIIPRVMKTGSANLNFLCNFSQLPQCLILACLLGGESLMAEACRAYLARNVIFLVCLAQTPPLPLFAPYPLGVKFYPGYTRLNVSFARYLRGGVVQLAFFNCCLKEVCRRTSLSPMKVQV